MSAHADLRVVLAQPSQIVCECGHTAHQHGAVCFCVECTCDKSIDVVIKLGYRKALSTALDRLEEAERQQSLAIAHDRQPYPTAAAYEAVCAARDRWQARAEEVEAARAAGTRPPRPSSLSYYR